MNTPTFEWGRRKAAANLNKHSVSFAEAATVFQDPLAGIHSDPEHSLSEERHILIGHSKARRLLLVAFPDRHGTIRLISAWAVTRRERRAYEEDQEDRT